eukprot:TRINITY_DN9020_c0_g1_i1.p1 TRINITY_DN9020_c0_g1~~TRINITY_DN9020_c0_g1_i1.p1  ORF type:complete len:1515 (+),score=278.16 TRINITY_DN9020_c0_g1_i1:607-4545(+)
MRSPRQPAEMERYHHQAAHLASPHCSTPLAEPTASPSAVHSTRLISPTGHGSDPAWTRSMALYQHLWHVQLLQEEQRRKTLDMIESIEGEIRQLCSPTGAAHPEDQEKRLAGLRRMKAQLIARQQEGLGAIVKLQEQQHELTMDLSARCRAPEMAPQPAAASPLTSTVVVAPAAVLSGAHRSDPASVCGSTTPPAAAAASRAPEHDMDSGAPSSLEPRAPVDTKSLDSSSAAAVSALFASPHGSALSPAGQHHHGGARLAPAVSIVVANSQSPPPQQQSLDSMHQTMPSGQWQMVPYSHWGQVVVVPSGIKSAELAEGSPVYARRAVPAAAAPAVLEAEIVQPPRVLSGDLVLPLVAAAVAAFRAAVVEQQPDTHRLSPSCHQSPQLRGSEGPPTPLSQLATPVGEGSRRENQSPLTKMSMRTRRQSAPDILRSSPSPTQADETAAHKQSFRRRDSRPDLTRADSMRRGSMCSLRSARDKSMHGSPRWGRAFRWRKGAVLGTGAFGTVHIALDEDTGEMMAVKNVTLCAADKRLNQQLSQLRSEIDMMKKLSHENIVQYRGTERGTGNSLNIFMEYVAGGSLLRLIEQFGALTEQVAGTYTVQILEGLKYLHENKAVHRDIKGANILLTVDGVPKLADFGAATYIQARGEATLQNSVIGTPNWMPPEVVTQNGHAQPADIWSLGCTVMEMVTGKPPWAHVSQQPLAVLHFLGKIASNQTGHLDKLREHFKSKELLSPSGIDFLVQCLQHVPADRPTVVEFLGSADKQPHPWLAPIISQGIFATPFADAEEGTDGPPDSPATKHAKWVQGIKREREALRLSLQETSPTKQVGKEEKTKRKFANMLDVPQASFEVSGRTDPVSPSGGHVPGQLTTPRPSIPDLPSVPTVAVGELEQRAQTLASLVEKIEECYDDSESNQGRTSSGARELRTVLPGSRRTSLGQPSGSVASPALCRTPMGQHGSGSQAVSQAGPVTPNGKLLSGIAEVESNSTRCTFETGRPRSLRRKTDSHELLPSTRSQHESQQNLRRRATVTSGIAVHTLGAKDDERSPQLRPEAGCTSPTPLPAASSPHATTTHGFTSAPESPSGSLSIPRAVFDTDDTALRCPSDPVWVRSSEVSPKARSPTPGTAGGTPTQPPPHAPPPRASVPECAPVSSQAPEESLARSSSQGSSVLAKKVPSFNLSVSRLGAPPGTDGEVRSPLTPESSTALQRLQLLSHTRVESSISSLASGTDLLPHMLRRHSDARPPPAPSPPSVSKAVHPRLLHGLSLDPCSLTSQLDTSPRYTSVLDDKQSPRYSSALSGQRESTLPLDTM